eukprot:1724146-Rhodomonas_salina.2
MSTYNWKNHPFEKLHEMSSPNTPATLSSFVVWKDGVIHSTRAQAVGSKHISMLIKWLMARTELIPTLAEVGIQID